jgi:PAS domain S-box-containing protein
MKTKKLEEQSRFQEKSRLALLNVMEDLSEAKLLIEKEKARDDAMLNSLGEGLIATDNDKNIVMINKVTSTMLGWKLENVLGKKITAMPLLDEEQQEIPITERPAHVALSKKKEVRGKYFLERKDKTVFPVSITATPIMLKGEMLGLIEIIRDITTETETDKAKSEFVSLASHQLRTPLGIIKWYLEALETDKYFSLAPKEFKELYGVIYKSNERVLSLVRDLLSVSRIDQGKSTYEPELTDLGLILEGIVKQMQVVANKRKISLKLVKNTEKVPLTKVDLDQFHEVMYNLIGNAIKYSPQNSVVKVKIYLPGKNVNIDVKDQGIGISAHDQKKLFSKFYRAQNAIDYDSEGTGLGLYVVKSYVEFWGGKVSVKSTKKGSTFTIKLKIAKK